MESVKKLYISEINFHVSETLKDVGEAVNEGAYSIDEWKKTQYKSISIDERRQVTDMLLSLRQSEKLDINRVKNISFSHIHDHGLNFLASPHSIISKSLGIKDCSAVTLMQGCNGLFSALELQGVKLKYNSHYRQTLLMAADCFSGTSMNRWSADDGIVYGNAECSVLLDNKSGDFEVLAMVNKINPDLEALHRQTPLPEAPILDKIKFDIRATKKRFIQEYGAESITTSNAYMLKQMFNSLLDEMQLSKNQISHYVLPHLGQKIIQSNYCDPLDIDLNQTNWKWGCQLGHLGCSDQFISLEQMRASDELEPNNLIALIGAGSGFNISVTLIKYIAE